MLLDILQQRRSHRHFTTEALTEAQRHQLQEALLRAPSSRGRQPWEFICIDKPEQLQQLAAAKAHGSAFLAQAAMAFVLSADPEISDVWVEDCAVAATCLQLTAQSLGLGSCWAQIRCRDHNGEEGAEDYVRRILGLPSHLCVAAIIGLGHPAEAKEGHFRESLPWHKIHNNGFTPSNP